jgi:peptidoglycan/xylan/chitin deacetylase (PgdA/CDA1 family)
MTHDRTIPYRYGEPLSRGFTWPNGGTLAVSIVVNVEEGAEQNVLDGDRGPEPVDELGVHLKKPVRIHGNETNYAYGINQGAPRIVRLLDQYGVPATWTVAALALERAPALAAEIVRRGDEPCCHGHRWQFQLGMDEERERDFIKAGTQSIERTCGRRPAGWLSRYLHTDDTRRLLREEGYLYHMDDYSGDFPYRDETTGMIVLPYAIDSNDMKMWTHGVTPRQWSDYAFDTFDWLLAESRAHGARMMSLGLHLRIVGRPGRICALERFLDHVRGKEGVWVTTRERIAEAFGKAHPR